MDILYAIAEKENLQLEAYSPLTGGDVSRVFLLKTHKTQLVIKLNKTALFPEMFAKEARGLELLANTNTFRIPHIINFGEEGKHSYLLMEYIPYGKKGKSFDKTFGKKLAQLHACSSTTFGLKEDNYIGSLPQYNICDIRDAATFYMEKRLKPQLDLAAENGYSFKDTEKFFTNITSEIPNEKPALIHGDLWSGNYLINEKGNPCLIDPAVCFASREMDLAMMHLFGGFPQTIFDDYNWEFPLTEGWEKRLDIWQIYYLLVHLNLFGSGYYARVKSIITRYC